MCATCPEDEAVRLDTGLPPEWAKYEHDQCVWLSESLQEDEKVTEKMPSSKPGHEWTMGALQFADLPRQMMSRCISDLQMRSRQNTTRPSLMRCSRE